MSYSSPNTIATVAKREIQVASRSKAIMFSLIVVIAVMLIGVFAGAWFAKKDDGNETPKLGLVGIEKEFVDAPSASANGTSKGSDSSSGVEAETVDTRDAASSKVTDGDLSAALVKTDSGYELLTEGEPDPAILSAVSAAINTHAQSEALHKVGVSPEEFAKATPSTQLETVDLKEEDSMEANGPQIVTALVGVMLMAYFIILFAANVGGRITEEKSSRVVEIILASARPMDFLAGKIIGNTIFGFLGTAVLLIIGAVAVSLSGLLGDVDFDYTVVALMLLAFCIGMLFFGSLYAAAGSMVSRTEDLQSTQAPILLFIMGMTYAPLFGISNMDSTLMQVLGWIPPFSLTVAPMNMAAGTMGLPQVLLSFLIAAITTVLVILLVARVYRNSILNNGKKMSWAKALKGA